MVRGASQSALYSSSFRAGQPVWRMIPAVAKCFIIALGNYAWSISGCRSDTAVFTGSVAVTRPFVSGFAVILHVAMYGRVTFFPIRPCHGFYRYGRVTGFPGTGFPGTSVSRVFRYVHVTFFPVRACYIFSCTSVPRGVYTGITCRFFLKKYHLAEHF